MTYLAKGAAGFGAPQITSNIQSYVSYLETFGSGLAMEREGGFSMSADNDQDDLTKSRELPKPGFESGRYCLIERIGAGGMGEIFLAEDPELNRLVVLKLLPEAMAADADCRMRFRREAQAAAKLNHPNIVTIYEIGEFSGRPYISMEHLRGQSLRQIIRESPLSLHKALDIGIQLCRGLKAAHAVGIIHRDIKPANVLHDGNGVYKLADFGLASFVGNQPLTRDGSTVGTVGYMSPEQVRGEPATAASDIFSFGVVLYELLCGKPPFHRANEAATLNAILCEEPSDLYKTSHALPPELVTIISRCLEKDRHQRYQDADSLLIELESVARRQSASTSSTDHPRSHPAMAVLPFANLSADKEQDYFCDGIAEEIINALSHIENLWVVARTSSFLFKGKDLDIREIGRRLNVGCLLEGSVRRSGNRLRVIAQLINVADGYHIWSERFDRQLEDVFAIQDEIALKIVEQLKVKLLVGEKARLTKRHTEDQEAYNLYLQGRHFWNRRHEGGLQKGIAAFELAVQRDPDYAPAWVGIADCYNQLAHWGYLEPIAAYSKAKQAIEKALAIDTELPEVYASLGWIKLWHDWDWAGSEQAFKRALELNPHYAMAHEWYALYLAVMQRIDEGLVEVRRAAELDPLSTVVNSILGVGFYWAKRFDEAVLQLNKTIELEPTFPHTYLYLCWAYAGRGAWSESIAAGEKFVRMTNGSVVSLGYLGAVSALAGDNAKALDTLEQLEFLARGRYVSPLYRALIQMGLGHEDEAINLLEAARQDRESFLPIIYSLPLLDRLRANPRFLDILRQMGLEVR